jgi:hypothetical protein
MLAYFQICQNNIKPYFLMFFQHSVLDETISEAVGIVADTDKWYVG